MKHRVSGILALVSLASACQPLAPTKPVTAKASPVAASPSVKPSPAAIAGGGLAKLRKPAAGATVLGGRVLIDAGYAVDAGAAGLITQDGASALALGKGSLITQDGASAVATAGGAIVAQGAGNLIAQDGASIISSDGASLIGDNGSGLIGDNGSGLINQDGASYRLQAADAPALGTQLPAVGMVVYVVALATNQALPLGEDASGKRVYAVYTNAKGEFELYLPPGVKNDAVRLMARPIGNTDTRLTYNLVVSAGAGAGQVLDEDQALLGSYLRRCLVYRLLDAMGAPAAGTGEADPADPVAAALKAQAQVLSEADFAKFPPRQQFYVAQRLADWILAQARVSGGLDKVPLLKSYPGASVTATHADEAILAVFKLLNAKVAEGLRQQGGARFAVRPYMVAANRRRAARGLPALEFKKPSDVGDFLIDQVMANRAARSRDHAAALFEDFGAARVDLDLMLDAGGALGEAMAASLGSSLDLQAATTTLRAAIAEARKQPAGPAPSVAPSTAPAALVVSTLAGTGEAAYKDGEALTANFNGPTGLAFVENGDLLVTDYNSGRIRQIALGRTPPAVSTVFSSLDPAANGLMKRPAAVVFGAKGLFYVTDKQAGQVLRLKLAAGVRTYEVLVDGLQRPSAMVKDAQGNLFLVEEEGNRVRKIDLTDPAKPVLTTVAGTGTAGFLVGPALEAQVDIPRGLVVDATGALVVSDAGNRRLRRLTAGRLEVFAGDGKREVRDGYWTDARFFDPGRMALHPDGSLIMADTDAHVIRRVTPAGDAAEITTIAGVKGEASGSQDGPAETARFHNPTNVLVAPDGTIYVADTDNHRIRVIRPK